MTQKIYHVLNCDGLHQDAQNLFEESPHFQLTDAQELSETELSTAYEKSDFFIIRSATKVKKELIDRAASLKGVIRAGVGVDNIELNYATEKKIPVWNAPNGNFQAAAELSVALIFALARSLEGVFAASRNGNWSKKTFAPKGVQIQGKALGLIGAGNIGQRVGKMCTALGMSVNIYDPYLKAAPFEGSKLLSLENCLQESDFISIHLPLNAETKNFIDFEKLSQMKSSAFLINVSRGGILNEAELLKALDESSLAGAALDVFEKEPFDKDSEVMNKILSHPQILCTPHMGASTSEAQRSVGVECFKKLLAAVEATENKDYEKFPSTLNKISKLT